MSTELSELFDRNPFNLSDQDIDKIVARMREAQAKVELGIPTKTVERAKKPKVGTNLLKELGLE